MLENTTQLQQIRLANRRRRLRYSIVFLTMFCLSCLIVVLNINSGTVQISVPDIVSILFLRQGEPVNLDIIWRIRLPRILMASLLGGALSLSGFLLQTFFRNPIAGPYILGVSSGAKMVVALTMIFSLGAGRTISSWEMILAAFVGSLLSIGFVLLLSQKIHSMSILLVGGIMISYICSAVTDLVVTFADDSNIVNLHSWSLGSFSGMTWDNVSVAGILVGVTFLATFLLVKPIGAYQLGEAYAQSMGLNVRAFRVVLILLSSLLSACVTAFAGPISFVGIAVPHLVKRGLGSSKPIVVVPAAILGGSVFCMLCDLIARTAFAPTDMNISTITAIFGAPVVIAMLLRRKGVN